MSAFCDGLEDLTEGAKKYVEKLLKDNDRDDNKAMDEDELKECMQIIGLSPTPQNLDFLFEHLDKDKTGKIPIQTLVDNIDLMITQSVSPYELGQALEKFDLNKDGKISLTELTNVLTGPPDMMPPDEARKCMSYLCDKYQRDEDGLFTYNEFVIILRKEMFPLHEWRSGDKVERDWKVKQIIDKD